MVSGPASKPSSDSCWRIITISFSSSTSSWVGRRFGAVDFGANASLPPARKRAACLATQDFDLSSDEATDRTDRPSITTASTA